MTDGPLIVQSDKTLLLEVDHERAADCRRAIAPFAELERSPEHIHTYRLTPLGLWNARAAGHDAEQVVDTLLEYSRYAVPHALLVDVAETMARYGRLRLEKHPTHGLVLVSHRPAGARGGAARQEDRRDARRPHRRRHRRRCTPPSAATSSRRCSSWAGRPRTSPATSTARRTRSSSTRPSGTCATTSATPPSRSGTAAPASSCCPAAPARRWSARPRWRTPRRPR